MIPLDAKLEGVALLSGVGEEDDDDRPVYENVGKEIAFRLFVTDVIESCGISF